MSLSTLFKRKEQPMSEENRKILERLSAMKEYVRQLQTQLNYGEINELQYQVRISPILRQLDEMERAMNEDSFDEQMGRPLEFLEEIFKTDYNREVHKAIERVEDESNTCDRNGCETH